MCVYTTYIDVCMCVCIYLNCNFYIIYLFSYIIILKLNFRQYPAIHTNYSL